MIKILFLLVILIIFFYILNRFLKKQIKENYLTYFLPFYNQDTYDLSNFYLNNDNNKNYFKKKFDYDNIKFGCIKQDYYFVKNLLRFYISTSNSVNSTAIIYQNRFIFRLQMVIQYFHITNCYLTACLPNNVL